MSLLAASLANQQMSADEILASAKQAYAAIRTYSDTATVRENYPDRTGPVSRLRTTFERGLGFRLIEDNVEARKPLDAITAVWTSGTKARVWRGTSRGSSSPVPNSPMSGDALLFNGAGVEYANLADALRWALVLNANLPASPVRFLGRPDEDPLRDARATNRSDVEPWSRKADEVINGAPCYCVARRIGSVNLEKQNYTVWVDKTNHLVRRIDAHTYPVVVVDYFPVVDQPLAGADLEFELPRQVFSPRPGDGRPFSPGTETSPAELTGSPAAVRVLARVREVYARCRSYTDTGESMSISRSNPMARAVFVNATRRAFETRFDRKAGFRFDTTDLDPGAQFRSSQSRGYDRRSVEWTIGSVTRSWTLSTMNPDFSNGLANLLQSFQVAAQEWEGLPSTWLGAQTLFDPRSLLMPGQELPRAFPRPKLYVTWPRTDTIRAHRCFVVEVGGRDPAQSKPDTPKSPVLSSPLRPREPGTLIWIDQETYLIRKIASNDGDYTATFEPNLNRRIPLSELRFTPPQAKFNP